jgi:hypothetical protein
MVLKGIPKIESAIKEIEELRKFRESLQKDVVQKKNSNDQEENELQFQDIE